MASTLKINTLTGVTTAGSIAVTGEGNSTTTNLQQGLGKAWCDWNQAGTQAIRDSLNISSISDGGTGKTTLNINNDMANDDWCGVLYQNGNSTDGFDNHYAGGLQSKTTGSVLMTGYASNLVDAFTCDLIVMGDLA